LVVQVQKHQRITGGVQDRGGSRPGTEQSAGIDDARRAEALVGGVVGVAVAEVVGLLGEGVVQGGVVIAVKENERLAVHVEVTDGIRDVQADVGGVAGESRAVVVHVAKDDVGGGGGLARSGSQPQLVEHRGRLDIAEVNEDLGASSPQAGDGQPRGIGAAMGIGKQTYDGQRRAPARVR